MGGKGGWVCDQVAVPCVDSLPYLMNQTVAYTTSLNKLYDLADLPWEEQERKFGLKA